MEYSRCMIVRVCVYLPRECACTCVYFPRGMGMCVHVPQNTACMHADTLILTYMIRWWMKIIWSLEGRCSSRDVQILICMYIYLH
jgi:hypothetical protein